MSTAIKTTHLCVCQVIKNKVLCTRVGWESYFRPATSPFCYPWTTAIFQMTFRQQVLWLRKTDKLLTNIACYFLSDRLLNTGQRKGNQDLLCGDTCCAGMMRYCTGILCIAKSAVYLYSLSDVSNLLWQTPAPWTKEGKKLIQELGLKMVVSEKKFKFSLFDFCWKKVCIKT